MEARAIGRFAFTGLWLLCLCSLFSDSLINSASATEVRSQNFIVVSAPSAEFARQVIDEAERVRKELALKWLGRELPRWERPCTLSIVAGNIPAQGVTTYQRYPGYVSDFQMEVVGTPQRILDSVLPHEVTHTVLATHFGQPLPRWADEGISTTVEHNSERSKHEAKLREFLLTRRGIPMNRMFMMKEYPPEMLTLYAQGYSVCRFMIEQKGPREFIKFLETFMQVGSWTQSVKKHYDYESLSELQQYWLAWVEDGSQDVSRFAKNFSTGAQPTTGPASEIMLASGRTNSADPLSLTTQPNTQQARPQVATEAKGWYAAVRDGQVAADTGSSGQSTVPTTIARPYSVAQPQPEQGAISNIPAGPSSPWTPQPARIFR